MRARPLRCARVAASRYSAARRNSRNLIAQLCAQAKYCAARPTEESQFKSGQPTFSKRGQPIFGPHLTRLIVSSNWPQLSTRRKELEHLRRRRRRVRATARALSYIVRSARRRRAAAFNAHDDAGDDDEASRLHALTFRSSSVGGSNYPAPSEASPASCVRPAARDGASDWPQEGGGGGGSQIACYHVVCLFVCLLARRNSA